MTTNLPTNISAGATGHVAHTNTIHSFLNVATFDQQIRYVSKGGNDSNDGMSWGTAKLTINSAVNSLPEVVGSGATFHRGVIYIGAGLFVEAGGLDFTNSIQYIGTVTPGFGIATTIQLANGQNTDLFRQKAGFTDYAHGCLLANLRLSGNKANNSAGSGVRVFNGGYQTNIINVVADRFAEYGFRIERNAITLCCFNLGATNNDLGAMFIDVGGSLMNLTVYGFQFDDNGPAEGAAITISHNNTSTGGGNIIGFYGLKAESQTDGIQDKIISFLPRVNAGGNPPIIMVDGLSASVAAGSNTAVCHEANNSGVGARWIIRGTNTVNYANGFQSAKTGVTVVGDINHFTSHGTHEAAQHDIRNLGAEPAAPSPTFVRFYGLNEDLYAKDSAGIVYSLIPLRATTTWDPASMGAGASVSTTLAVTGAAVGDVVRATLSTLGANKVTISAHVSAANTVFVTLVNETGGTLDLASGTLKVHVFKG